MRAMTSNTETTTTTEGIYGSMGRDGGNIKKTSWSPAQNSAVPLCLRSPQHTLPVEPRLRSHGEALHTAARGPHQGPARSTRHRKRQLQTNVAASN